MQEIPLKIKQLRWQPIMRVTPLLGYLPHAYYKTSSYWVHDLKSFVFQCNTRLVACIHGLLDQKGSAIDYFIARFTQPVLSWFRLWSY